MSASAPKPDTGGNAATSARAQLLNAAEELFAKNGIEGVSLREIAAAAGQRNNSAVHYYFNDKKGLVDALIADRVAMVEAERSRLADAGDIANRDMAELLRMLWQPMLDICRHKGGHWFVQFHLAYHLSSESGAVTRHPIVADPVHHPASGALLAALRAKAPHLGDELFRYRLGLLFMMFWAAVARYEKAAATTGTRFSARFSLAEPIKIAVAALSAPA